jgi:hypothetical protein
MPKREVPEVTIEGYGVPVVFDEFQPGKWCATIWPGPSGFGDTPAEALVAAMKSWPDAFGYALSIRGREVRGG